MDSESSGLFVLLFGVPALLFAIVFAAVAWKAPRGGAVLCGLLLASVAPLLLGVDRVGYMKDAGIWLKLAVAVAAGGLAVSLVGLIRRARRRPDTAKET